MADRNYWLDLFTGKSWGEFLKAGGKVSGFSENRWKTLQKVKPRDYFLCYLTGVSRFVGILEVISRPFKDSTRIWGDSIFPSRVEVKIVVAVDLDYSVPVKKLKDKLSCFQNLKNPNAWTGRFRGSPSKWSKADDEVVVTALREAKRNPERIPIDQKALLYRPKSMAGRKRSYTVPPKEEASRKSLQPTGAIRDHLKIQHLLYEIARSMGIDVWIARNDRGRRVGKYRFGFDPGADYSIQQLKRNKSVSHPTHAVLDIPINRMGPQGCLLFAWYRAFNRFEELPVGRRGSSESSSDS